MNIKELVALILCLSCTMAVLPACGNTAPAENTKEETNLNTNILQKEDPSKDDTLEILMIGSSYCYYYVEELWGMLNAAGIKAKVCNVYYSGCSLKSHWEWWKNGEAHYDFFVTDENGRVKTEKTSLEYCLQQGNWDIISLQDATRTYREMNTELHLATSQTHLTELWGYIKEQFPMSRYLWHQPWSYQIGYDKNGLQINTLEQQWDAIVPVKEFALAACKEYQLERVNTGEAWHIVRQGGYDNMCARIGINNDLGDYSHDGDIGGGQYLNACVWFEIITGQSCIGNTYRPDYTLDESLIETFQKAAHQAVEQKITEDAK